jgi:hypothetical protein
MDIAAEARATTATSVALEIKKEIGQHRRVKISQVMRALNNATEMREAVDDGAGVMDSYSRCEFWINAFTGAKGQTENHWLACMREQCQWTKNERRIDVQQRDPYLMEEQLANISYYLDKFAPSLGSKPEEQREPYTKRQKVNPGCRQEDPCDKRSSDGFKHGRPLRENAPRRDTRAGAPPRSGPRGASSDTPMREQHSAPESPAMPNPFSQMGWTIEPAFFEGAHIWVKGYTKDHRKELKDAKKCFVCKSASHQIRACPNLNNKYKSRTFATSRSVSSKPEAH